MLISTSRRRATARGRAGSARLANSSWLRAPAASDRPAAGPCWPSRAVLGPQVVIDGPEVGHQGVLLGVGPDLGRDRQDGAEVFRQTEPDRLGIRVTERRKRPSVHTLLEHVGAS